eukprot:TRINITY_DN6395_c0_g1_i7.p4 TRINITY_DN6395_c0_g1~~TRINITY_DN6395_c0_g1_i7.p4  ORF type:complete len:221 (+),score=47.72 TRINITY_DN6395_c0_g1_i7:125-787(+)
MTKLFVIFCVTLFVSAARHLKQSGISNTIAQADANADQSLFTRDAADQDSKKQSQAQVRSIFESLSAEELQAAAQAAAQIQRFNKNNGNGKVSVNLQAQGVVQVEGQSNNGNGVASNGGVIIQAQATPTSGAVEMESRLIAQANGRGSIRANNEQGLFISAGAIETEDGEASFTTQAGVEDSGRNTGVVIQSTGSAIVTEDYSKSAATACVSTDASASCD